MTRVRLVIVDHLDGGLHSACAGEAQRFLARVDKSRHLFLSANALLGPA